MNIDRILLIIIIIYLIFSQFKKNKNREDFAFSDTDKNEIRGIIKEIYNTDMDAIRTLADFAKKIQDGNNLNIPGNLTVTGALNVSGTITGSSALNVSGTITGYSNLNVSGNINSNYIYTNTLDIKGKYGTTHFNYGNGGTTYLRDDVYVHDYLQTNKFKASGKSEHGNITIDGTKINGGTSTLSFDSDNVLRHYGNGSTTHNQRFATGTIWADNGDGQHNWIGYAKGNWLSASRMYFDGQYRTYQW